MNIKGGWNVELSCKPDFEKSLERIYAWYEQEIIDRPPIKFISNNQSLRDSVQDDNVGPGKRWATYNDKWFDVEGRLDEFEKSIEKNRFLGDTLPVFWANFSPHFIAGLFGAELTFDQTTGWIGKPILKDYDNLEQDLVLNLDCKLYKTARELMSYAMERGKGKYLVSYPDMNYLGDTLEALRGTNDYLMDLMEEEDGVKKAHQIINTGVEKVYDQMDALLKSGGSMSVNWMTMPCFGKMITPTADIATMFSPAMYEEFYFDEMDRIINSKDVSLYHVDGKGVAKHLDLILEHKKLNGIQWVQGMGEDRPILQWVPLIRKVQAAGKSIVCDVDKWDLEAFISEIRDPKGILLYVESHDEDEQREILKRIERW